MLFLLFSLWSSPLVFAQETPLDEERAFLNLINGFRTELKLSQLNTDSRLFDAAEGHAEWMAGKGLLTHSGPGILGSSGKRIYAEGVEQGTLVGENIARGSYSGKDTFIQWFFSPAHLGGMLNSKYTHIGIARRGCSEELNNSWYCFWVTDFADLSSVESSLVMGEEASYSDEALIQAAESVVGPLDSNDKLMFKNPTQF